MTRDRTHLIPSPLECARRCESNAPGIITMRLLSTELLTREVGTGWDRWWWGSRWGARPFTSRNKFCSGCIFIILSSLECARRCESNELLFAKIRLLVVVLWFAVSGSLEDSIIPSCDFPMSHKPPFYFARDATYWWYFKESSIEINTTRYISLWLGPPLHLLLFIKS